MLLMTITFFNILLQVNVKDAQSILQKTITWTNKYGKKKQEWEKTCIECGMPL